jgi:glycosyltransferase involved in cell wall biosynthesis
MAAARQAASQVARLGLSQAVTMEAWVPHGERLGRLAAADVAVTLDPGGIEARFAFRTRLLDALWAGVPTLATDGEHVACEAVRAGAGWVVPPADAGALRDLLVALAADRARVEAAARHTAEVAARYRYDRLIEPLDRFCREPVRRRPGAYRRGARQHAGRVWGQLRQRAR